MEDKNKLQEEIVKSDNKNIEKMWKAIDEETSFKSFLEKMTKDELVKIAKKYSVKGLTTLKKADVVERMMEVILNNTRVVLELMEESTLRYLEDLTKENGLKKYECNEMIYINYLRNRGLAFSGTKDDEAFVIVPKELREIISSNIDKDLKEKSILNEEIIKATAGMVYYFGVCKIDFIKSNINKLFAADFDDTYISSLISSGEEVGYDYVIDGDMLCHIDVEDVEKIITLQEEAKNDYYKFDKKSLIKAGKIDFVEENKQVTKLEKVLGELFVIDKNILKEEMDSFIVAIKNEVERSEAIDIFLQAYEIESEQEREIFTYELDVLAKSIRKWSLKGYTEDEIAKEASRVVNVVKIGRNDPCICGSGKKYKKCCG